LDNSAQNLRGLKALVIGLGVLIVLGTALVIGVVIKRMYDAGTAPAKASGTAVPGMPPATLRIPAAAGAAIGGIAAVGGRLAVWVKDGQGGKVVLIDPQTDQLAGTVTLAPR
jgi:hypothetical protein